jgi:hypothetical protein
MRSTKQDLIRKIHSFEANAAWKWQIERLQSEVSMLKNVLIDAGILINVKGEIKETVIVVDGELYSIRKAK